MNTALRLSKEFHYLQRKFEIFRVMDATLWRFLRLRPDNFPHIRLAQLAYLYQKGDKVVFPFIGGEDIGGSENFALHPYFCLLGESLYIRSYFSTKGKIVRRTVERPDYHQYRCPLSCIRMVCTRPMKECANVPDAFWKN